MENFFCLACLFFLSCSLRAQQGSADSVYAKHLYDARLGQESALYNGIRFYSYPPSIEGIAFFESPDWQTATVVYENVRYDNVLLKYDLVKDQVIITPNKEGGLYISLFSPRVSEFSFSGLQFIRLGRPGDGSGLPEGFYQQLTAGKLTVFARKTKKIYEQLIDRTIMRNFEYAVRYYVQKNGTYHLVQNMGDLMDLVKERKKEVQQLLSSKKIKYRRNPEDAILSAVKLYNQPTY